MEDWEKEILVVVVDKLECFCGGFVLARGSSGTWAVLRTPSLSIGTLDSSIIMHRR